MKLLELLSKIDTEMFDEDLPFAAQDYDGALCFFAEEPYLRCRKDDWSWDVKTTYNYFYNGDYELSEDWENYVTLEQFRAYEKSLNKPKPYSVAEYLEDIEKKSQFS